jgi:hypothetical protein
VALDGIYAPEQGNGMVFQHVAPPGDTEVARADSQDGMSDEPGRDMARPGADSQPRPDFKFPLRDALCGNPRECLSG